MIDSLLQFTITGIFVGGVYALIALGIVLIYKATGIFNFAVGQFVLIGAFLCWSFMVWAKLPILVSILLAIAAMVLLGLLIERSIMRPLLGQPLLASIMVTVGLMILINAVAVFIWGPDPMTYPADILPQLPLMINGILISRELAWAFVVALLGFGIFAAFFRWSRVGLAMRATADDQQLARATGVNVKWIFGVTWVIAATVAAMAGILLGARLGISARELPLVAFKAFPVVILGGLDSITGVIVAGLIIGVAENVAGGLIDPRVGMILPYFILLITLLIRPEGLFGMKRIERI